MSDFYKKGDLYIPRDKEFFVNNPWIARIDAANTQHNNWESKFKCATLEDYYEGFQWKLKNNVSLAAANPYTINLVYSTIKIKMASLLFQKPKFLISPEPGSSNWNQEFAIQSAQIKEDVLNTIVRNRNVNFPRHIKMAAKDAFFRFGIIEIGYANDWRNPQKVDPELKSWTDPDITEAEDKVVDNNDVPINERFYIKRIPPWRFRVASSEAIDLNDHDWCGYYDYYYTRTLMNTKGIKWPENYSGGMYTGSEYASGFLGKSNAKDDLYAHLLDSGELSRVWHIWDNVSKQRLLLLEDDRMHELWTGPIDRIPLVDLRWDLRSKGFYPIPPVFQWLSPQDEINEAREQTRSYRRRFTRKFQAQKGAVDPEELEKFASGPDGIVVEVKQPNAISAIDNPEMGPTAENALILAKDDFNIISGTSAEARGQGADRETATVAKIVDMRSQIRESAEQLDFSVWLAFIGREMLCQVQERMETGLWIKYTGNPGPQNPKQMEVMGPVYQYITGQQIDDGYDFEIELDVQNGTPAAMQAAQQAFVSFMSILASNPLIMMSPMLIREAAFRVGYRNEAIIKQVQEVAIAQAQMKAAEMQNQQGQQGNNPANKAKTQAAQMATPPIDMIQKQIGEQLQ